MVAYINLGSYYAFGLPLGYLLGYTKNLGVQVSKLSFPFHENGGKNQNYIDMMIMGVFWEFSTTLDAEYILYIMHDLTIFPSAIPNVTYILYNHRDCGEA